MRLGILPLGRPTFDVPFAKDNLTAMLAVLDESGHEIVGPRALLFDEGATRAGIADLQAAGVDQVLILQVTFTDAAMTVAIGAACSQPLSIWAVPEPRLGGRLRLNALLRAEPSLACIGSERSGVRLALRRSGCGCGG